MLESQRTVSSMYHNEQNQSQKEGKETKNKNQYSSEETVNVIVHGVSPEGGRQSMVGRVCEAGRF